MLLPHPKPTRLTFSPWQVMLKAIMDNGWFRGLQQYFSRIGTIKGWTWKALCNEAPFRFRKILASSWIRTRDSEVGIFKATKHKLSKGVLTCDILEAHFSSLFSIYSSAGYGLCTLTARRRIVLAPPSQALSIFFVSLSLKPHLLYDYTTSKIMAIQVMIFTHFTCGQHGKSDLHADFVCTFIFFRTYGNTNIKKRLIWFCDTDKSRTDKVKR